MRIAILGALACIAAVRADSNEELVFPFHPKHNHSPCIVECGNGDLLMCWYRGSGERRSDDVVILGARKRKGESKWSEPFELADTPDLPDCNPVIFIDDKAQLHLFYPAILDNNWESAVLMHRISTDFLKDGCPTWSWQQPIFLKPEGLEAQLVADIDSIVAKLGPNADRFKKYVDTAKERAKQKIYQRLGWMPRCRPIQVKNGDILVPLYCDTFSVGILAISSDRGKTFKASQAIVGIGAIQPSIVERKDGGVVAFMRENGTHRKIRASLSPDGGRHWGPVYDLELPNPGSSVDAVRLQSGNWILIYNDQVRGRHTIAAALSDDEGKTWKISRRIEDMKPNQGSAGYPSVLQTADGVIHVTYRYHNDAAGKGSTIKHVWFNEDWVKQKPAQ